MTKFNWDRVHAENLVKKNGFTYAIDALYPSDRPLISDRALKPREKSDKVISKIPNLEKVPDFLINKVDPFGLHDFLCQQVEQIEAHGNWTKLFQVLRELPAKIRSPVVSWIELYSPWVVLIEKKQLVRLIKKKDGEYKLDGNPPVKQQHPEVEFSRNLPRGGSLEEIALY